MIADIKRRAEGMKEELVGIMWNKEGLCIMGRKGQVEKGEGMVELGVRGR